MKIDKNPEFELIKKPMQKNQEQWTTHFNSKNKKMISISDMCFVVEEKNNKIIDSLRQDFKDHVLMTSIKIVFSETNLSGKIIHNAGSTVVQEKEILLDDIPVCSSTPIRQLLVTDSGLAFVRALLDSPHATLEEIINMFVVLTGKDEDNLRVWTPNQSSRASDSIRSVVLYFYYIGSRFNINCVNGYDYNYGVSRGVTVRSAQQTVFYSNRASFDITDEKIIIPMLKKQRRKI